MVAHTRKPAAEKAAEAAETPAEAEKVEKVEKTDETPEAEKTEDGPEVEVKDGVSADVQALRDAHANQPVIEVAPTNDGEETQSEVLERLSRERKAQQLASDLVPDNAPE